jgi:raffinose/stachyose/melibiose transport system permease protein
LLISAGLERIPSELLEAARVDGATEWKVFWEITMPLIWSVLRLLFVVWIIESLQTFTLVYVMVTHGTGTTEVITTLMYNRAFHSHQWGLACAMATLLLTAIFSLSLFTNWLTKRETIQY